ncbi:class I SAM-dependent methyltransferase [Foetidibacter luteolus]|uniref:class I SAM-dependent methyltransferase n=1 Tax=Foetidibacter luteolus TaxID=2608880 RepID=UPI00129A1233|nr:class I SAM-dependent methyltransferase [Foetidibacter luteolus]
MSSGIISSLKNKFHPAKIKRRFLHYAMKGKAVQCPCCGSSYVTFLPAGLEKRANARCINCDSLERQRTLWLYLNDQQDLLMPGFKMLHIAPEKQFYKRFSVSNGIQYYPGDLFPLKYRHIPNMYKVDVTDVQFGDAFFDCVMCNHVLEHVPNDSKAMQEFYRILKPGGWAILNVPIDMNREKTFEDFTVTDPKKRLELFGQDDHVRLYGSDYVTRLQAAGFSVEVIDYVKKFSHNEQFRYGLKPVELIFLCRKK